MLILIPTFQQFSEFPTLNSFLGKFRPKKSKLSVLPENCQSWYLEDGDTYFNISFLNLKTKIHFWAELRTRSGIACFVSCSCTMYLEGAALFHLKSVTVEDKEEAL